MVKIPFQIKPESTARLLAAALISALLMCGCSGGGKEEKVTQPLALATVTSGLLKLGSVGTTTDLIAGIDLTVNLPAGVTVDADPTSGEAVAGAVTISGTAVKGNSGLIAAKYSPAAAGAPAMLHIVLINAAGFSPGEFVTVRFNLKDGTSFPALNTFSISGLSAKGLDGSTLSGITGAPLSVVAAGNAAATKQARAQLVVNGTFPFYMTMMVDTPTKNTSQTISGTVDLGLTPIILTSPAATVGPVTVTNGGSWSAQISGLTEGANIVTCTATDPLTNETASVMATIILDTTKPDLNASSYSYGTKYSHISIGGTVDDYLYHVVKLEVDCPSATVDMAIAAVPVWSAIISNLTYGDNTCHVTAYDLAGNHDSKDVVIHYDNIAPDLDIHFNDLVKYGTVQTISGTVESGITPVMTVNGSGYAGTMTVNGSAWSCQLSGLAEGANTITVTATDSAGNVSTRTSTITAVAATGSFRGLSQPAVTDALKALRIAVGFDQPTTAELLYGDLFDDGKIDLADAILILEKTVGL